MMKFVAYAIVAVCLAQVATALEEEDWSGREDGPGETEVFCMQDNCYDLMETSPSATLKEIKNEYRDLSKKFHPDRLIKELGAENAAAAQEKFEHIARAYSVLKSEERRARYDKFLADPSAFEFRFMWRFRPKREPMNLGLFPVVLVTLIGLSLFQLAGAHFNKRSTARAMLRDPSIYKAIKAEVDAEEKADKKLKKARSKLTKAETQAVYEDKQIASVAMPAPTDLIICQVVLYPLSLVTGGKKAEEKAE